MTSADATVRSGTDTGPGVSSAGLASPQSPRGTAAGRPGGVLHVVGRLGWGVADQAVSSLSNFAIGLYVARTFGAVAFGAFTLAFVTYSVVLNAARGTATDPMLVRYSGVEHRRWRRAASAASATALMVGVAAGLVCLLAGLLLPDPVGSAFVALGVGLPGLMLQDSWRFVFFAHGRPASALVNDLVWLVLLVLALIGLQRLGDGNVFRCLLAFGGTASLAAIVGSLQAGVRPRPARTVGWLREHRQLSARYLVENVSASGSSQIRSFVLGAVAGLAAVGYVRGAELLMGPFLVVLFGVSQVAVPEASLVFHRSSARLARFCLVLGGVQGATALAWGLGLLVILPLGPGRLLLKDLWMPTSHLVPAVTLSVVAASFLTAALAGLRAMGVARRSLRAQLITSTVYVVGGAGGAVVAGATGTCWGVALANTVGALVWWYQLRAALTDHHQSAAAVTA